MWSFKAGDYTSITHTLVWSLRMRTKHSGTKVRVVGCQVSVNVVAPQVSWLTPVHSFTPVPCCTWAVCHGLDGNCAYWCYYLWVGVVACCCGGVVSSITSSVTMKLTSTLPRVHFIKPYQIFRQTNFLRKLYRMIKMMAQESKLLTNKCKQVVISFKSISPSTENHMTVWWVDQGIYVTYHQVWKLERGKRKVTSWTSCYGGRQASCIRYIPAPS